MKALYPIKIKDKRTGKIYAIQAHPGYEDAALAKMKEKMDHDYFESLPAVIRISKKVISLDFNCPFCVAKTEVSSRKEKIVSGFLFFVTTRLIDIFKCEKCQNEFTKETLYWKQDEIERGNNVIINYENWKDANRDGRNPPEFFSLTKVDEIIISSF